MKRADELAREVDVLRERLSRLSEANVRINESLDFDTVLQGILDSARSLTGARFGLLVLADESGGEQDLLVSGLAAHEHQRFMEWFKAEEVIFEALNRIPGPLRRKDFNSDAEAAGFRAFRPPVESVKCPMAYLAAPILHRGASVGSIYVSETESDLEFTAEDEETLVMFASQAAMVIANARRYRDEQRARAYLETVINTSPVGVVVFDAATGDVVSINREVKRIAGVLRLPDLSLDHILKVATFRRADGRELSLSGFGLRETLRAGETVRVEEIVVETPDGGSLTVLVNSTPILSPANEVESVVVTVQDMTPLEELEMLRSEFVGMVSHELRTPLTAIKGAAATLLEASSDLHPAEMREFHRIINEQADHMRDLIGDLLDVTRIETGTLRVDPEPVHLPSLVDEARSRFHGSGGRESLQIDLASDLPAVMADRRRILQVLTNLLSNASNYSTESSAIRLTAKRTEFHVAISVSDDGRGIAVERLPHVFRKFFRISDSNRMRDVGGAGLGLAICKGIVEAHGGRIWAESDGPGLGTRFTFTLPVAEEADPVTEAIRVGASQPRSDRPDEEQERQQILVVDDDPQTLRYTRHALATAGYAPIVTGDPADVPRIIRANNPRLVLLDLMLPGSDGIELMGRILNITDVPVVFMSAYAQDDVIARAFDAGAVDYIVKPFSPTELVARIRAALRERSALHHGDLPEPYVFAELTVDYAERRVTLSGQPVRLTSTEYQLLAELSRNAGRVVTYDRLLRRVWKVAGVIDMRPMRTAVKSLRRKLNDDAYNPTYIFTETRVGYRMAKP